MLGSIAFVIGGIVISAVGVYLWRNPEIYYRYLHSTSLLSTFTERPPMFSVKLGAALSVAIGLGVALWGLARLAS